MNEKVNFLDLPLESCWSEFQKEAIKLRDVNRKLNIQIDHLNGQLEQERNDLHLLEKENQLLNLKNSYLEQSLRKIRSIPHLFKEFITKDQIDTLDENAIMEMLTFELSVRRRLVENVDELKLKKRLLENDLDGKKVNLKKMSFDLEQVINKAER